MLIEGTVIPLHVSIDCSSCIGRFICFLGRFGLLGKKCEVFSSILFIFKVKRSMVYIRHYLASLLSVRYAHVTTIFTLQMISVIGGVRCCLGRALDNRGSCISLYLLVRFWCGILDNELSFKLSFCLRLELSLVVIAQFIVTFLLIKVINQIVVLPLLVTLDKLVLAL